MKGAGLLLQTRFSNRVSGLILIALMICLPLAAASCGDSGVAVTIEGFLAAAKEKNCEKMVDYIDLSSQNTQNGDVGKADLIKACNDSGGLGNVVGYRITGEKVDGDTAVIGIELTINDGGQEKTNSGSFNLVRKDGIWKLTAI